MGAEAARSAECWMLWRRPVSELDISVNRSVLPIEKEYLVDKCSKVCFRIIMFEL